MKIAELAKAIEQKRLEVPAKRSMLVGISGIDGSGKGHVAGHLSRELELCGCRVAVINADGWLNLPKVRLDRSDPPGNFYRNGLRLNEMFTQLVLPVRDRRSISLVADLAEETASEFTSYTYYFEDIDVVILEGIFIFKRNFVDYFDLKIWINCSFEKALERAVERSQEGLSPRETVLAYETIYFPAQQLHIDKDVPVEVADLIFDN